MCCYARPLPAASLLFLLSPCACRLLRSPLLSAISCPVYAAALCCRCALASPWEIEGLSCRLLGDRGSFREREGDDNNWCLLTFEAKQSADFLLEKKTVTLEGARRDVALGGQDAAVSIEPVDIANLAALRHCHTRGWGEGGECRFPSCRCSIACCARRCARPMVCCAVLGFFQHRVIVRLPCIQQPPCSP